MAQTGSAAGRDDRLCVHGRRPLPGLAQRPPVLRPARARPSWRSCAVAHGCRRGECCGRAAGLGRSRPPTGARSSPATTSTSSTSARPATPTATSPSRRSRQASTCCARSRWPTPWPRRRRWSRPPTAAQARGVLSMVGFNYRRTPALALARELVAEGRLGRLHHVRAQLPPGLDRRPAVPAGLAAAEGQGRLRRAGRHRRPHRRPRRLPHRRAADRRLGHPASASSSVVRCPSEATGLSGTGGHRDRRGDRRRRGGVLRPHRERRACDVRGDPVRHRAQERHAIELNGSDGSLAFDFERLNELQVYDGTVPAADAGFRRILVTEPDHPYAGAWWPPGHGLGYEHTFVHEIADFVRDVGTGDAAVAVVRRRALRPAGDGRRRALVRPIVDLDRDRLTAVTAPSRHRRRHP